MVKFNFAAPAILAGEGLASEIQEQLGLQTRPQVWLVDSEVEIEVAEDVERAAVSEVVLNHTGTVPEEYLPLLERPSVKAKLESVRRRDPELAELLELIGKGG